MTAKTSLDSWLGRALSPPLSTADLPGTTGVFRETPEDFRVEEIPAYAPSGEGEHLFVRFEKRGLTTPEAVRALARALATDPRETGYAGLKDRQAVTVQWASFPRADAAKARELALDGIRVLEAVPHRNKLRVGHLRGNRFELRIRGAGARAGEAASVLERLTSEGAPNYYGAQRFGRNNVERAMRWLVDGERAPRDRFEKKMLASALQSALFNLVVADRVEDHLLARAIRGDVLRKEESGGIFVCTDPDVDGPRVLGFEVSPTGPMYGPKMTRPADEALVRETAALDRTGVTESHLTRAGKLAEGTRRALRVRPEEALVEPDGDDLLLRFTLSAGSYATVIAREVVK